MKKLIISFIAVFYLSLSCGLAMNLHFCGKKLERVQFNTKAIQSCCSKTEEEADHCCKNQEIVVKVTDQHESVSMVKVPNLSPSTPVKHHFNSPIFNLQIASKDFGRTNWVKPPPQVNPIHLQISVFRI